MLAPLQQSLQHDALLPMATLPWWHALNCWLLEMFLLN